MDLSVNPASFLNNAASAGKSAESRRLAKLRASVDELEVTFLNEMVKAMRKNVPESELFKKNSAEKMFEEMQDKELTRAMCQGQNFGLADAMYRQMAPLIEHKMPDNS